MESDDPTKDTLPKHPAIPSDKKRKAQSLSCKKDAKRNCRKPLSDHKDREEASVTSQETLLDSESEEGTSKDKETLGQEFDEDEALLLTTTKLEECVKDLAQLANVDTVQRALRAIGCHVYACEKRRCRDFLYKFVSIHGGIQSVFKAMQQFPDSEPVQSQGIYLLHGIVSAAKEFAPALLEQGALNLLLDAMERFHQWPASETVHALGRILLIELWQIMANKRGKSLSDDILSFWIPCIGRLLPNLLNESLHDRNNLLLRTAASLLWGMSKTGRGREAMIEKGLHTMVGKVMIRTTEADAKEKWAALHLRLLQDHYGDVRNLSKKLHDEQDPF